MQSAYKYVKVYFVIYPQIW